MVPTNAHFVTLSLRYAVLAARYTRIAHTALGIQLYNVFVVNTPPRFDYTVGSQGSQDERTSECFIFTTIGCKLEIGELTSGKTLVVECDPRISRSHQLESPRKIYVLKLHQEQKIGGK